MIRPLLPPDADAFMALRREALNDTPVAFGASVEDDKGLVREHVVEMLGNASEQCVMGWFDNEVLVAMVGLNREQRLKARHRGGVWGVYVTPAARGRGIMKQLLEAIIVKGREWGLMQIDLGVSNKTPNAKHVYESVGFRSWGIQPNTHIWNGVTFDEEFMTLLL